MAGDGVVAVALGYELLVARDVWLLVVGERPLLAQRLERTVALVDRQAPELVIRKVDLVEGKVLLRLHGARSLQPTADCLVSGSVARPLRPFPTLLRPAVATEGDRTTPGRERASSSSPWLHRS